MEDATTIRLTETEARSRSNTRRIEQLEKSQETLSHIATSVEVLVAEQRYLREEMKSLGEKVDVLERKPGGRWEAAVDKMILLAVTAVVGFLLTRLGLSL